MSEMEEEARDRGSWYREALTEVHLDPEPTKLEIRKAAAQAELDAAVAEEEHKVMIDQAWDKWAKAIGSGNSSEE